MYVCEKQGLWVSYLCSCHKNMRAVKWKNNNNKVITYTHVSVGDISEYVMIINTEAS